MRNIKNITVVSLILILISVTLVDAGVGTSALPFLRISPSARAEGMGATFVAVADDASASYWNPAGIANLDVMNLTLMHLIYVDSSSYELLAFNYPLSNQLKLGAHIIYLNYGSMEKTIETSSGAFGGSSGTFSSFDLGIAASVAYKFSEELQLGLNAKYAMQSIDTDTVTAVIADVGALYKLDFLVENLLLGLSLSNVGTKVKDDNLPTTLRGGVSMKFSILQDKDLLAAVTAYYPFESGKIAENVGAEYWYDKMFGVRLGYKIGYDAGSFTAGVGFKYVLPDMFGYQIDYSYAPFGNLGDTHRISATIKFGEEEDTSSKARSKTKGTRISPTK